ARQTAGSMISNGGDNSSSNWVIATSFLAIFICGVMLTAVEMPARATHFAGKAGVLFDIIVRKPN
ncbi:MAG TPA: hypothetical protein DCR50_18490, partial [Afipia sp.]|nr:hypothetical protein [Afipia sp.]